MSTSETTRQERVNSLNHAVHWTCGACSCLVIISRHQVLWEYIILTFRYYWTTNNGQRFNNNSIYADFLLTRRYLTNWLTAVTLQSSCSERWAELHLLRTTHPYAPRKWEYTPLFLNTKKKPVAKQQFIIMHTSVYLSKTKLHLKFYR